MVSAVPNSSGWPWPSGFPIRFIYLGWFGAGKHVLTMGPFCLHQNSYEMNAPLGIDSDPS
jgi:hypothetical protein